MPGLEYERGNADAPVGHAFLYFTTVGRERVTATYLVIPPVAIEFAKYIPPLLASSLGSSGLMAQTAFLPIPPLPEEIELEDLRRLAVIRGDDVLVGGAVADSQPASLLGVVADTGDAYARAYQAGLLRAPIVETKADGGASLDGLAVLYSVLTENERIEALARQVGSLRYAIEVSDNDLAGATQAEMQAIARYLPERYRAEELIHAAGRPDADGARLVQLFIERGYKLSGNDPGEVATIESEIASLLRKAPGS
ncbi:MAG: hypothetical protein HW416_772 [Chloroflexi bacterium]|nr:hypothetical protein [Chloroflexota bacterium]